MFYNSGQLVVNCSHYFIIQSKACCVARFIFCLYGLCDRALVSLFFNLQRRIFMNKNILFTLFSFLVAMTLMTHSDTVDAFNGEPMFTVCYHEVDGVLGAAYEITQGGAPCPPCASDPQCSGEFEVKQTAWKAAYDKGLKDTPEIPPHLCKIVLGHEW